MSIGATFNLSVLHSGEGRRQRQAESPYEMVFHNKAMLNLVGEREALARVPTETTFKHVRSGKKFSLSEAASGVVPETELQEVYECTLPRRQTRMGSYQDVPRVITVQKNTIQFDGQPAVLLNLREMLSIENSRIRPSDFMRLCELFKQLDQANLEQPLASLYELVGALIRASDQPPEEKLKLLRVSKSEGERAKLGMRSALTYFYSRLQPLQVLKMPFGVRRLLSKVWELFDREASQLDLVFNVTVQQGFELNIVADQSLAEMVFFCLSQELASDAYRAHSIDVDIRNRVTSQALASGALGEPDSCCITFDISKLHGRLLDAESALDDGQDQPREDSFNLEIARAIC